MQTATDSELEQENEDVIQEQESDKPVNDELSQGDLQNLNTWVSLGLSGGVFFANRENEIRITYNTLHDVNPENLLDLKNPTYYNDVRLAHRNSNQLAKQKGLLNRKWYMSRDDIKRRTYSLIVARKIQKKANDLEIDRRIKNAVSQYGLNDENATNLKTLTKNWLKDHPGGDINQCLIVNSTNLYLKQNSISQADANLMGKKAGQLTEENKKARDQVIQEMKDNGMLDRAKSEISNFLDPNSKIPDRKQLRSSLEFVENGKQNNTTSQTTNAISQPTNNNQTLQNTAINKIPSLPRNIPVLSSGMVKTLKETLSKAVNQVQKILKNLLSKIAQKILETVVKIGTKILKTIGWETIKGAIGAATAGIFTAVDKGLDVIKLASFGLIDVKGWIWKPIKFTGELIIIIITASIIGFLLFCVIVIGSSGSGVFDKNTYNNKIVLPNEKKLSWSEFQQIYLSDKDINIVNNSITGNSWSVFMSQYLQPKYEYLSLNPNWHDDVKK